MTNQGTNNPNPSNGTQDIRRRAGAPAWFTVAAGAMLVATFAVVMILLLRDDGEVVTADESTTTAVLETTTSPNTATTTTEATTTTDLTTSTDGSTTTTTDATTTTTTPPSTIPPEYSSAVWPWFNSPARYTEPAEAAAAFARDFLKFADPIVGEFQPGDNRSGEVPIQPVDGGPITTVFVRQLGTNDDWWILGAATANIVAETPEALCEVSSPLAVSGEALVFEGNVEVMLRADDAEDPLATANVTGGGSEMAPFAGELTFVNPAAGSGAVVFLSRSAENGAIWEASVVRVLFGEGSC